ncbi:hypothetical protein ACFL35_18860 [Candidatus Riflebacteria bacterium]
MVRKVTTFKKSILLTEVMINILLLSFLIFNFARFATIFQNKSRLITRKQKIIYFLEEQGMLIKKRNKIPADRKVDLGFGRMTLEFQKIETKQLKHRHVKIVVRRKKKRWWILQCLK